MELHATVSIWHLSLKFPTSARQGCVQGNQREARECYNASVAKAKKGPCVNNMVVTCYERNEGTDEVVNMEVDVERNTLLEPGAPFKKDLLL